MYSMTELLTGLFSIIVVIYSIILHEIAHGYAAYVQGDETAYRAGRLTLNPFAHIDVTGSVIVPLLAFFTAGTFFGWAKPVPYNPYNIRTRIGQAFVAAAGILMNLLLALAAGVVLKVLLSSGSTDQALQAGLFTIIGVNVSLAFFNLIPIPPFDGMSILQALFPRLEMRSRIMYSPVYMVLAIIAASVLYGMLIPHVFNLIEKLFV
jgi:Zn-dependent protease